MLFTSGDRIVFTGDSVTDAGRGRPVGEGLWQGVGDGYVRTIDNILNVVYPDWRIWVSNTGTSGDTSRSLKKRWQEDVMNLKPDWVSLMIGINDNSRTARLSGGIPRKPLRNARENASRSQGSYTHVALLYGAEPRRPHEKNDRRIHKDL